MKAAWIALGLSLALAACGEKPQVAGTRKADVSPVQGSNEAAYTAPGWKAGDATSWEAQMKARAQFGQNEYARSSAP
jgi:hypothetical protein